MIRPFTCVCLVLAAGSGLYLYQVKQRAFALDASLRSTFHDIDAARERTRMLRADWALVNDPERLQALASQYLTLQPMQPSQLLTMDRLATALPAPLPFPPPAAIAPAPVSATPMPMPASTLDPTHGVPMAEASPVVLPHTRPATPEVALLQPVTATQPQAADTQAALAGTAPPAAPTVATSLPAPLPLPQPPDIARSDLAPPDPARSGPLPHLAGAPLKPLHHWVRRPAPQAQPWLAQASGLQPAPRRHADHHVTPDRVPAPRQFYATNLPQRDAEPAPRITPQAATVMYRPALGSSSLGMASSAALAPPRPLYSTSQ